MKLITFCNRIIEYSFYLLFLFIPLLFNGGTSELFELNKMWVTFGLTVIIGAAWTTKMVVQRKVIVQRTPIDIALLLFLLSQIISTFISLDQRVSWWGYYSRFNGGLLSTISYIFLYYAFVSNLQLKHVLKTLTVSLVSGLLVCLWGLPSHFGADPTCLVFRGSLDTSCWTDAFKPTIREFSTLGQPAWLAAYLAALLPLALAYALNVFKKSTGWFATYIALSLLFYANLLFANTRAGFIAFAVANIVFWAVIFIKKVFATKVFLQLFLSINIAFIVLTFLFGIPINGLQKFTLPSLQAASQPQQQAAPAAKTPPPMGSGITDSGDIRLYVWQGALDAWKAHPLFGTGVETFAFAYYQFKPAGHNLTSEWDFLYNKAHNEYLNYLTTTGIFGLGTYLLFLVLFVFFAAKVVITSAMQKKKNDPSDEKIQKDHTLLSLALVSGWISILISNFFGFSVVIINIYLFFIPAFVFMLQHMLNEKNRLIFPAGSVGEIKRINPYQWTVIAIIFIVACTNLIGLLRYWYADTQYALGSNFNRVGSYQEAYPLLINAVTIEPSEPTFSDELAMNLAIIATALYSQKDTTNAEQFANNAIALDNQVIEQHPNNVVFLKNRVRLFYMLAQGNPKQEGVYYAEALKAIQRAYQLAPTDAKIIYNLGVLYGQTGNIDKAIETMQQTVKLKPDYRDAYFALGLFYHEKAIDKNGNVIDQAMQQKAIDTYKFILEKISPKDAEVEKSLKDWQS
jgi:putative inorganic carbon (hco3(-)) transporter